MVARRYRPRAPERTALYRVVQEHLATMLDEVSGYGGGYGLPRFVTRTFDEYLRCGILAHGFARVRCDDCGQERLIGFSCKRRGLCHSCEGRRMADTAAHLIDRTLPAVPYRQWTLSYPRSIRFALARHPELIAPMLQIFLRAVFRHQRRAARKLGLKGVHTGAVTFVQRFGSTVNLHVHFHALIPDGVFVCDGDRPWFHRLPAPTDEEVFGIACRIVRRTVARLERMLGDTEVELTEMDAILTESAQSSMPWAPTLDGRNKRRKRKRSALVEGFSLHAGGAIHENDRQSLERVLRYGARPPISQERLHYDGRTVTYRLRKPSVRGDSELRFRPTEFLRRLASLIPPPRQNLTRYHGVFAPRSKVRVSAPAVPPQTKPLPAASPAIPRRTRLAWAELLRRVFEIDVTVCEKCAGPVRVISQIKERAVIIAILEHLGLPTVAPPRGPPRNCQLDVAELDPSDSWSEPA